mmetsp:Transcript_37619/g.98522  ORF Transcript_37619/g.98522 Transcript_37619/m.98522 type:complete len:800 (+) Transcript_37619:37-2436(+)
MRSKSVRSEPAQIAVRLRPVPSQVERSITADPDGQRVWCHGEEEMEGHSFSKAFHEEASTREIYDALDYSSKVDSVLKGCNEAVITYGCTGSGKTFTTFGGPDHPGLLRMFVDDVFEKAPVTTEIWVSCLELKSSTLQDRLADVTKQTYEECHVTLAGKKTKYKAVLVQSVDKINHLVHGAMEYRSVGATAYNDCSSRSHAIIRVHVRVPRKDSYAEGTLIVADLAGSERELHNPTQQGREEARLINQSLTQLNRTFVKMQFGELDTSDRRQGALNAVLYPSFKDGGVSMIFCVDPRAERLVESRHTVHMAARCLAIRTVKEVRQRIRPVEVPSPADAPSHPEEHALRQLSMQLRDLLWQRSCSSGASAAEVDQEIAEVRAEMQRLHSKFSSESVSSPSTTASSGSPASHPAMPQDEPVPHEAEQFASSAALDPRGFGSYPVLHTSDSMPRLSSRSSLCTSRSSESCRINPPPFPLRQLSWHRLETRPSVTVPRLVHGPRGLELAHFRPGFARSSSARELRTRSMSPTMDYRRPGSHRLRHTSSGTFAVWEPPQTGPLVALAQSQRSAFVQHPVIVQQPPVQQCVPQPAPQCLPWKSPAVEPRATRIELGQTQAHSAWTPIPAAPSVEAAPQHNMADALGALGLTSSTCDHIGKAGDLAGMVYRLAQNMLAERDATMTQLLKENQALRAQAESRSRQSTASVAPATQWAVQRSAFDASSSSTVRCLSSNARAHFEADDSCEAGGRSVPIASASPRLADRDMSGFMNKENMGTVDRSAKHVATALPSRPFECSQNLLPQL